MYKQLLKHGSTMPTLYIIKNLEGNNNSESSMDSCINLCSTGFFFYLLIW